jgi:hypothetical protein
MAFKMKGFKAHDMFNPKTGEKFVAKKLADHERMDEMGYTHDSPKKQASPLGRAILAFQNTPMQYARIIKKKKGPCWKNHEMVGMKSKGGRKVPNCVPKK